MGIMDKAQVSWGKAATVALKWFPQDSLRGK